ncbi:MAG: hypothetical protein SGI92_30785 [Bryobacteraceae bacterium]|nr:hypothetical protein [Bryobacteraceae bacterium]
MKGMTAQEQVLRIELDADLRMKGLRIVDYEQYQPYQQKLVTWVVGSVLLTIMLGLALGLGTNLAHVIIG